MAVHRKWLLLLPALLVIGGCSLADKTNTIEEISPVIMLYLEEGNEDGAMKITTVIPPLRKEKKSLLTASSDTLFAGRFLHSLKYFRETKAGQIRMIFFSEDMAERGLSSLLDVLRRDPEISSRVFFAVVGGDMIGYLDRQLRHGQEQIDLYLYQMFAHYEKQGQITIVNMHEFLFRLYDPYADPVLPYFHVADNKFRYSGTALFRGDRMVGKVPLSDDVFFQMLRKRNSVQKTVPLPEEHVVLGNVKTERSIAFSDSFRKVRIDVRLRGRLEEFRDRHRMTGLKQWRMFERALERKIEEKLKKIVARTQSLSIDPFGLGLYTVGWLQRPFPKEQWNRRWPEMDVDIRVELMLENISAGGMSLTGKESKGSRRPA